MKKVVIVILNYMNYKETFCCVNSILSQKNIEFEIVIVDNGSLNESYTELKRKYKNNNLIHVLRSRRNYGFAKGNNIGINYAKSKLSADFVLLLNSDVELIHDDYISLLVLGFKKNIGVISSRIIQQKGSIPENYSDYVNFPDTLLFYLQLICEYYGFSALARKISQLLRNTTKTEILHGSCLMLTPSFFEHYKMLYHRTFLYSEEILLYIFCRNANLIQMKIEETSILHKGKMSSKYLYGNRGSVKRKYLIASYKYVVWESFKAYLKSKFIKYKSNL